MLGWPVGLDSVMLFVVYRTSVIELLATFVVLITKFSTAVLKAKSLIGLMSPGATPVMI